MTVHWQTEFGSSYLCGVLRTNDEHGGDPDARGRCLDSRCDRCEGNRDKVDCPACIAHAREIAGNLAYFFRVDGPHTPCRCGEVPGHQTPADGSEP